MKLYKYFSFLVALALVFPGCEMLEPEDDNHNTIERVYEDPSFAEGLLIRAYTLIPTNDYRYDEVATDDAVTNDQFSSYKRIATGEWSALYNPQDFWGNCNTAILYINHFLDVVDEVPWKWTDATLNDLYKRRLTGEAYALRGMFKYFLLRNHGGVGTNGELLGIPEYNEFIETQEEFERPRASFSESVASAYNDFEEALKYLPMDYGNVGSLSELPASFNDIVDVSNYNDVFGDFSQQRMSGRHSNAIKAKLALLAASPAFNPGNNNTLWEDAANFTAELLDEIGGIDGIDEKGHIFYLRDQVEDADLSGGDKTDIQEILWRRPIYTNRSREQSNFPPSLYGSGRINPSQNLVDAFPMANGYPITDANANFDPDNPYANRDPRLSLYVVYDGSTMKGNTISTGVDSGDDGLDVLQNSTRTGYYLRKLLREDVNVNPSSASNQRHFNTHIRYTELFLNYAEAANEAWGPNSGGPNGYSAKDVIAAIRKRAGIAQPDEYLNTVNDKETMRELIRNERRLELCFEGFRFWDLRRWKADLTVPANGVRIENGSYTTFTVEERGYDNSYMHYGPIPDREITKFNLIQNNGWN
ncbi:RagB/SusD family nutrient uptake outer membrane protein [Membranihabitans marinus]|uniref:RagB/SusD family nutrient uptake outer membrane protein n=1 Tax=Membranihabitans marinus TaxID=1227546 RepID=UPI001F2C1821|nr:RagB/SusD family nutrient uptake outer membrane protein [Membranihabitans marinus]